MRFPLLFSLLLLAGAALAGCISDAESLDGVDGADADGADGSGGAVGADGDADGDAGTTGPDAEGSDADDADDEPTGADDAGNATETGNDGNTTDNGTYSPRPFDAEEPEGSCDTLAVVTPEHADPTGLVLGWDVLRLDMALLADPAFVEAHPDDWATLLEELVADASGHYEQQVGIRLDAALVDRLPDGSLAPGSGDGKQRAVARGYMETNHPDADVDMVAVVLGADYEGSVAGQVECVHGAVDSEFAYLWTEYDQSREADDFLGSGVGIFEDIPLKTFMHETAHLLAAHHHYTNCGEAALPVRPGDTLAVCGLMINDVGLASFNLSPTNQMVVRSFVEELGIGEPVS